MHNESIEIKNVSLKKIFPNPHQPRKTFSSEELQELADSIVQVGVIHPPVVERMVDHRGYLIVAGERRVRAAELAGLEKIPVIVRENSPAYSAYAALVENIHRVDLNPLEIARSMKSMIERYGHSQEELAQMIGKKRSTVANYLRLLTLPQDILASVSAGTLSMGHAKALLAVQDKTQQQMLYERVMREGLSVRQTEKAAQRLVLVRNKKQSSLQRSDLFLKYLTKQLEERLGTSVTISGSGETGKICIDYYSLDDIDRLMVLLGIDN